MKKLSLVLGLAFVGTFAFAQTTGAPKTGALQMQKPGATTTTVKTPPSTVAPAPAPTTTNNTEMVNSPTSVEKDYPEGQQKQTSPTAKPKTTKRPLIVKKAPRGKPNTVKSQTIEK